MKQVSEAYPALKETGRLEAFSDGVFAIAITLLVLAIPIPHDAHHLAEAVGSQWPALLGYVLSFLTILVMWINHHALFEHILRIDRPFLVLNGILLLVVTFVNYPTAILATSLNAPHQSFGDLLLRSTTDQHFAALLYSGTFIGIAVLYNILWWYASYQGRLIGHQVSSQQVHQITIQYRFGPLFYALAFLLAFISVPASLALNFMLALYFSFTGARQPRDNTPLP